MDWHAFLGSARLDPATGGLRLLQAQANDPTSLSNNRVNSVSSITQGTMWVGTQDGLAKFDPGQPHLRLTTSRTAFLEMR